MFRGETDVAAVWSPLQPVALADGEADDFRDSAMARFARSDVATKRSCTCAGTSWVDPEVTTGGAGCAALETVATIGSAEA